jgi:oxalate decarboxylase/phosphoglucose isomerase-like protein (cupin superfamily)
MRSLKIAVLLAALPLATAAQDAAKVDAGHYKVLIDNPSVRVLKVAVSPGEKSPMHSHPDAMLVALQNSKARFTLPDGKTQDMEIGNETAVYTPAATHSPANVGTTPVDAILVEFKAKEPGTASVPTSRPGMQINVLAESPRAIAFKTAAGAEFHEDPGTTHEYDQVVISLGANDMSLAVEGKPVVTKWQRGTAQFIGRGVKHESKNTSGRTVEFVVVAIR